MMWAAIHTLGVDEKSKDLRRKVVAQFLKSHSGEQHTEALSLIEQLMFIELSMGK